MWALGIRSCERCRRAKDFFSRNRIADPRHTPHLKPLAHCRPPIAPTLRPPRRHVARCAGPVRPLQPSLEIFLCDLFVPSSVIPRSIAITLNRPPSPGHLQFAGSRSFRAKDCNSVRVTEAGAAGAAPSGSPLRRNDRDQRMARLDAPRKYTFRHLPPFAICEDASVRDDWIVEPKNPYCFKTSTTQRALGPRRERTRGWRGHGTEVALPFADEGWFERPA
jgi:hypothetical protein